MDIATLAPPGAPGMQTAQAPPRVVADLRPAADAAALVRDPHTAGRAAAVLPAPLAQMAEVSRSLLASAAAEGPAAVTRAERVLKPWGVTMLPATAGDDPRPAPARTTDPPEEQAGE